ncbi:Hypothetical predicted protein [Octopus vulgaris]|uniref:Uncharacterized protein n=1 Tax=Octopus vulgaris TaxID=6645 RepID=A0AA36FDK7_OCTVU|nr:Hypothetical predicted protein [Octopus vulgaris]
MEDNAKSIPIYQFKFTRNHLDADLLKVEKGGLLLAGLLVLITFLMLLLGALLLATCRTTVVDSTPNYVLLQPTSDQDNYKMDIE